MEQVDVAIVGAGINGMTAAAALARLGLKTLVVEANPWPGGLAGGVPEGCPWSLYAYTYGLVPRELEELLGLVNKIPLHRPDPSWVLLDRNGEIVFRWWRGGRLAQEAQERGAGDLAWLVSISVKYIKCLKKKQLYYTWKPPTKEEAAKALDECRCELGSLANKTIRQILSETVPRWTWDLLIYPSMLDSNFYSLAYYLQNLNLWEQPLGGMRMIAQAYEKIAQQSGARFLYSARVNKILIEGKKAVGLEISGLGRLYAKKILLALPATIIPKLVGEDKFPEATLRELDNIIRGRTNVTRVDYLLRRAPKPPREESWRGTPILVYWTRKGGGEYTYPSLYTPGKIHLVQASGNPGIPGEKGPLPPGVEEEDVVFYHVRTPGSQKVCCGNPNGHPDHIPMVDPYLFNTRPIEGWGEYRVPGIENLYHGSASSYPGGEVNGVAGFNAALRILTDSGRKEDAQLYASLLSRVTECPD